MTKDNKDIGKIIRISGQYFNKGDISELEYCEDSKDVRKIRRMNNPFYYTVQRGRYGPTAI